MKNWLKIYILLFLGLIVYSNAQEKLENGEVLKLNSKILNEERTIWIHLPKSYNDTKIKPAKYPVIYLLDADINFGYFTGMTDFLSRYPYANMPESIVVAIQNTDRTRDLTPTKSSKTSPNNPKVTLFETSGGANQFLKFINEELKTSIQSKYRTTDFEILVGHSFGGLFAIHTLLTQPESFNAYIANDPSLWWDNQVLVKNLEIKLNKKENLGKNITLFLSEANNEEENKKWDSDMTSAIKKFNTLMQAQKQIDFKANYYPTENHGTVSYLVNFDGMKYIFEGFQTDVKKISKNPSILLDSYKAFSNKKGFPFEPSEIYLNFIIKFTKENNPQNEDYFTKLKKTNF